MFTDQQAETGKRASDQIAAVQPPPPRRDRALEGAIARDEVEVLFQPQIELETGRVVGAEALARWEGAASPEELFARARSAGLLERLSRTVQMKALRTASKWRGPLRELKLSINLLPEDLGREGYDDWLLQQIKALRFDPKRLTVEIIENVLLPDQAQVVERLGRLRDAGVEIAVDDFGTGYSSLAYLATLPLDTLKIDRGLVADIVGGSRHRIVVRAMIGLARELDLKVVVEGVESSAQLSLLSHWGCDLYQGFLGAGALNEAELSRFVASSLIEEVA
jgi:EAL domain-containing protein (putative c-di-GMP-specific phosphodiesterase class I)